MTDGSAEREQQNLMRDREIQQRSIQDAAFRDSLVRDPAGTLQREFGVTVPAGITVEVHEETEDTVHVVLPPRAPRPGDDDSDLRQQQKPKPTSGCCTCGSSSHQTFNI